MARIPYASPSGYPRPVAELMASLPQLNLFRMLAHAESVFPPYMQMAGAILTQMQLDPALRELAVLQVAVDTECRYEWIQHVAIAGHAGVSGAQIDAIEQSRGEDVDCFDACERAVLAFASAVVKGPEVPERLFAELRRHLGPREVVELLMTIGSYLMLARLLTTLELELDVAASGEGQ